MIFSSNYTIDTKSCKYWQCLCNNVLLLYAWISRWKRYAKQFCTSKPFISACQKQTQLRKLSLHWIYMFYYVDNHLIVELKRYLSDTFRSCFMSDVYLWEILWFLFVFGMVLWTCTPLFKISNSFFPIIWINSLYYD